LTIAIPQDLVSVKDPVHGVVQAPPLIQVRDRVCVPLPHFTEQALHAPYADNFEATTAVPQDLDSVRTPVHGVEQTPPLIQVRDLDWVPLPHFTEQALHAPYADNFEATIAVPQDLDSEVEPTQLPLQCPALMQLRVLVWIPPPHFVEQALHAPNAPHLAGTTAVPQLLLSEP
jgi:hypothetical protein